MVSAPADRAPADGYPTLYLLDGHALFGMARDVSNLLAVRREVSGVEGGLVVGVGYPSGEPFDGAARTFDFTAPGVVPGAPARPDGRLWAETGGAESFRDFLTNDLIPLIEREWNASAERRTLFGHSLGGLFAIDTLLKRPEAFRSYVAASPSLWFGGHPPAPGTDFAAHLAALPPRDLTMLVGSLEEPDGISAVDPLRAERQRRNRIRGNARDLLDALMNSATGLRANLQVLAGETHASLLPAAVSRAVQRAFSQS